MLVQPEKLKEVFQRVKSRAEQNVTPVQLFSSLTPDSICATRILIALLNIDQIPYEIHPVQGYNDIIRVNIATIQPRLDEVHSIILIGCGANYDLNDLFFGEEDPPDNVAIYVADAQRPFALENVHNNMNVFLLEGDKNAKPSSTYPEIVDESDDSGNESDLMSDDDSMSDEENMMDLDERPRKRRRKSDIDQTAKRQRMKKKLKVTEYYKFTYWARNPASFLFWKMASDLQRGDNSLLWLAILGLTDMFINDKMSRRQYDGSLRPYQDFVLMHNDPISSTHSQNTGLLAGTESFLDKSVGGLSTADTMSQATGATGLYDEDDLVKLRKRGHVEFQKEFQFVLMRHWNLMDSMYHSRYVATKLNVWKAEGMEKLKTLLVKMGVELQEARQPFINMAYSSKIDLTQKLEEYADDIGLGDEVMYGSFTKQHGNLDSISAADMVRALDGLIMDDKPNERAKVNQKDPNSYALYLEKRWNQNFHDALHALSVNNYSLLQKGIRLSIARQRDIVEMGIRLIEKKMISNLDTFRYAEINQKNNFTNAFVLTKLAIFLHDAWRRLNKNKKAPSKPFVLCALCDIRNTFLIVGVPAQKRISDIKKNMFGSAFEKAREEVGARSQQSGFESSVIEVQKDDKEKFKAKLQLEYGK